MTKEAQKDDEAFNGIAEEKGISILSVTRKEWDEISGGGVHQGVVAVTEPFKMETIGDILEKVDSEDSSAVLLLDGITDPQNLGSILRSAEIFGVSGVVIPKARTAALSPAVWKSSAGAIGHMLIAKANLIDAANRLKKNGFWLIGAEGDDGEDINGFEWPKKSAIVLGSEGSGLTRLVKKECDFLVSIPMVGKIASLNVSVSGGIILHDYLRKTGGAKK